MAQITSITTVGATSTSAWAGGEGNISVFGTFDGGSVRLEYSFDSGTSWIPFEDEAMQGLTIGVRRGFNFNLPACDLRGYAVNVGGATSLTVNIEAI
jgi:hypothetical protein